MSRKILDVLRDSVPKKTWNNWFSSLEVKKVDHDRVELTVDNLFIKDWLQTRFSREITNAIKAATGRELSFTIQDKNISSESKSESVTQESLVRKRPLQLSNLSEECTFENFQFGIENRFLVEAAKEISSNPGAYNPLFIYGGVGLGKTHIVQAIARRTMDVHPEKRIIYITSEQFLNEMVVSINKNEVHRFREEYRRKADALLIDDIQFLVGKKGVQNEFFHTFNHLHDAGKQLVICSDRSPEELEDFHERYVSRFQMGLGIRISEPSEETRFRIAKGLAKRENVEMSDEVAQFLARNVDANIRRLRGAIIKMIVQARIYDQDYDLSLATEVLQSMNVGSFSGQTKSPIELLFSCIKELTGFEKEELLVSGRDAERVRARYMFVYGMKNILGRSINEIASTIGRKHSTVIHALKMIEKALEQKDQTITESINRLFNSLSSKSQAS